VAREALPDYVRALLRRDAYPHSVHKIELVQTHMSYVFLLDQEVYKLKKPVDLGFVDFTSLSKRRQACEEEVRLNRRGCPGGVYLGVEPVTRAGNGYRIGGDGEPVEYAVHMKRLPKERMMDVLLEQDAVDFGMVGRLAGRLAALHAEAERGPEITRIGGSATVHHNWQETLDQVEPYVGRTLSRRRFDRIRRFANAFMDREAGLLKQREDDGWIRDCHGDLRSDAVCYDESLPGGICIYDCIEFNDRFRYVDTGLDAAFLAMDLDYRGRPDLSDLFVGLFAAAAGDKQLPLLLDFYKCYRACVRGKVESFLLADPGVAAAQKTAARRRARAYFELAERYATRPAREGIVLVTGPSGSGKSVLAGVLAARLGSVILSTDMLRRELFEPSEGRREEIDRGRYAQEGRDRVYREIEREAEAFLSHQRPVVIDGTYIERQQREPVLALAEQAGARVLLVECTAPEDVVRQRQGRREGETWTASEGRWEVYVAQKQRMQPADELSRSQRLVIDTTAPLSQQIDAVLARLKDLPEA
jgi:uncharacterized protein